MARYKHTEIIKDKVTNKRVLKTTEYPEIIPSDADIIYYAKFDDTLMRLADRFYGDQTMWWIIARANNFQGKTKFQVGQKLIIPANTGDINKKLLKLNFNQ